MSSIAKTPNYELNQWELTDKPQMADFNSDNEKIDTALAGKASAEDIYTKTEVDTALADKADVSDTYTKAEVNTALASKANQATTYTKTEVDDAISGALTGGSGGSFIPTSEKGAANGVASLDTNGKVTAAQTSSLVVNVTANKTLALADAGTLQRVNSSSAITVTIPTNASAAFPIGAEIELVRYGTGTVTLAVTGGVTLNSADGVKTISSQYAAASLKKFGTDEWLLCGSLG